MQQVYAVQQQDAHIPSSSCQNQALQVYTGGPRLLPRHLKTSPVDLLVLELASIIRPHKNLEASAWEALVATTQIQLWPKVILECWIGPAISWSQGPMSKLAVTWWSELGYASFCKVLQATEIDGALFQVRLLVAPIQTESSQQWVWPLTMTHQGVHPMSNLLTPPGLVPQHLYVRANMRKRLQQRHPASENCQKPVSQPFTSITSS
eukprot:CAMPEP_0168163876 /NCGR_PEP_ID=MMETSP0139_2-20121125/620_1 /TAXON_ID=44445 /ORGANISM="Pseudo-nitzschia australis, Strain 10249 10 AB" /LENGTH=206 /DNA_ID=CAMNT_0008080821 /DNA_START=177 /DNA_END=794 /DNA_ORIENTATION=-